MLEAAKPFALALVAFLVLLANHPCGARRPKNNIDIKGTAHHTSSSKGSLFIPANDNRLVYTGRYHYSTQENAIIFDWPCFSINISFVGFTSLSMVMDGGNNNFITFLDGAQASSAKISTNNQKNVYTLYSNTSGSNSGNASTHVLSLFKITEASYIFWQPLLPVSQARFYGLIAEGQGKLLSSNVPPKRRRIEVFGDSDSNGTKPIHSFISCLNALLRVKTVLFRVIISPALLHTHKWQALA